MNIAKNTQCQPLIDGKVAAQYFKFYLQSQNPHIIYPQQINRVGYKALYGKFNVIFDKSAELFRKQNVDIVDYIRWFVVDQHYGIKDLKYKFLNAQIISEYATVRSIKSLRKQIFRRFNKCANNIANECIRLNLMHCVDYIQMLISQNKLAAYYFTGKLQKHFLASIPKFNKIIDKLDPISRDEFHQISTMFDVYHREIADAMIQEVGQVLGPFSYVDELIHKKMSAKHME